MRDDKQYDKFISSLLRKTQKEEIKWRRLSQLSYFYQYHLQFVNKNLKGAFSFTQDGFEVIVGFEQFGERKDYFLAIAKDDNIPIFRHTYPEKFLYSTVFKNTGIVENLYNVISGEIAKKVESIIADFVENYN